jgi:hypothetical protein
MSNPIKKFFNGKRWNNVKTRKIMLVLSVVMVIVYTVVGVALVIHRRELNDQLTIEYFSYAKWLVATGGIITVAKVIKGKTNSDETEDS